MSADALPVPAPLVDLAARALAAQVDDEALFTDLKFAGDHWDGNRDVYRNDAQAVLAALLAGCAVREEWGARATFPDGSPPEDFWRASRTDAQALVDHHADPGRSTWTVTLIRRLVITTPAEEA